MTRQRLATGQSKRRLRRRISGPGAFASVGECGDFQDAFAWNEALRLGDALIGVEHGAPGPERGMTRRPRVTTPVSRRRSRRTTCSGCSTPSTSARPRVSASTRSSCWSHAGLAIDRSGAAPVWMTSTGAPGGVSCAARRLARTGYRCRRRRGGVERLRAPDPPSDRRSARCKCGRAGSAITTSHGFPRQRTPRFPPWPGRGTSTCLWLRMVRS